MHGAFPEVSESLPCVLLADALLKRLALVPELDDGLRVGVEGGDRRAHAAGEGCPSHADGRQKKTNKQRKSAHAGVKGTGSARVGTQSKL